MADTDAEAQPGRVEGRVRRVDNVAVSGVRMHNYLVYAIAEYGSHQATIIIDHS